MILMRIKYTVNENNKEAQLSLEKTDRTAPTSFETHAAFA